MIDESQALKIPAVASWSEENPREWYGWTMLPQFSPLRVEVVQEITSLGRLNPPTERKLKSYCAGLEAHSEAELHGRVEKRPEIGIRTSYQLEILDRVWVHDGGRKQLYVLFRSPKGWAGFGYTTNLTVIRKISEAKDTAEILMEIKEHHSGWLVEVMLLGVLS